MKKIAAYFLSFSVLGLPLVAFGSCESVGTTLCNPLGYDSLTEFLRRILQLIVQIGFPVIVLYIVFIGFKFITAEGKPDKLKEVQSLFFWAIIGALVVLGAEALSLAIQATVNDLQRGV